MKARLIGLGTKFDGPCAICHRMISGYQKETASLYGAGSKPNRRYFAVHTECAGGKTKHAIGGGAKYRTEPAAEIEVDA